jgi:Collagen triple helix repeat (20 copies)
LKKGIAVIAAVFGMLAITSGAFAAHHYLITSSSQIKNGTVRLADLAPGAREALHGANGANGFQGPAGPEGPKGDAGLQGAKGAAGAAGRDGKDGAPGFSPTAFGPYSSDSPDSSVCGNDWATDKMDRSFVVYPQADGSFLVGETFTNGTFTTLDGNSPNDKFCGSTDGDVAGGIKGTMNGYFLVKIPAGAGNFDPEAKCTDKCYTADFVQRFFGLSDYDVPVYELHYSTPHNGDWKNASDNRGGNDGNIN